MSDSEPLVYNHPAGRVCTFDADDNAWWYNDERIGSVRCDAPHLPHVEFGAPAMGIAGRSITVTKDALEAVDELQAYQYPTSTLSQMTVTVSGINIDHGEKGFTVAAVTDDARYILTEVLPETLERFLEKNRKYAEVEDGYNLGPEGIIPDLNRKLGILVGRIWAGDDSPGEPTEEVIDDMIGHLFLMRAKMRHE